MHVVRGLLQALIYLLACLAVALVAALLWLWIGGSFVTAFAAALLALSILVGTAGSAAFSRFTDHEERAFLGWGPERDESTAEGALTPLGVTLFVGVPMFVAGLVLLDLG